MLSEPTSGRMSCWLGNLRADGVRRPRSLSSCWAIPDPAQEPNPRRDDGAHQRNVRIAAHAAAPQSVFLSQPSPIVGPIRRSAFALSRRAGSGPTARAFRAAWRRCAVAAVALTFARHRARLATSIRCQRAPDVVTLLEPPSGVAPHVALVRARIDQFPTAGALTFRHPKPPSRLHLSDRHAIGVLASAGDVGTRRVDV